jgi:hypothetical protein
MVVTPKKVLAFEMGIKGTHNFLAKDAICSNPHTFGQISGMEEVGIISTNVTNYKRRHC